MPAQNARVDERLHQRRNVLHGTFVNLLDLSPAIQQDIITHLDPSSTFC